MRTVVRIRRYRDADEDAVLELWHRAGLHRPWLDLRAEIHEKRRRDRSLFVVAVQATRVVGAVMGAYDGRRGWIYHLAVEPGMQRRGIGRLLMVEVERRMARLGVAKVNLQVRADTLDVLGFYEEMGYENQRLQSFGKWLRPPPGSEET
jgi:ribosomal protein S18 acetylase RimI-like enzyme